MKEGKEISVYRFKCVKGDTVAEKGNTEEFLFSTIGTLVVVGLTHISKCGKVQMNELKIGKSQISSVDNMSVSIVSNSTLYMQAITRGRKQWKHTDDHSLLLLRPVHDYKMKHFQHNVVK